MQTSKETIDELSKIFDRIGKTASDDVFIIAKNKRDVEMHIMASEVRLSNLKEEMSRIESAVNREKELLKELYECIRGTYTDV